MKLHPLLPPLIQEQNQILRNREKWKAQEKIDFEKESSSFDPFHENRLLSFLESSRPAPFNEIDKNALKRGVLRSYIS